MPLWERTYGDLKNIELTINDSIQTLNNVIRNIRDETANDSELEEVKLKETQIDTLLRKYASLLKDMETFVKSGGSESQRTIYNRFVEVYKELSFSYRISRENAERKIVRIELFSNNIADKQEDDSETQLLLKEMTSTKNSLRMADDYLENRTARTSHEELKHQHTRLQRNGGVLQSISNRLPSINQLTRSAYWRKYRDNIIVAIFVAICICFCLWYAFH